ncbi:MULTISPECIES: pyridoxal phosphate-dependent aminotransferase [Salinibaculum]|uniref:pyridoxal phosphate-dependent aminotransferase n=1 Tax=Salinibaculum TaxID=2732368 RepID=UPI0030D4FA42
MDHIPFSGIRDIFEECSRLEREGEDIVHLEIGRPDFDTPDPIKSAAKQALDDGHVHYTSNYGVLPLRERLSQKFHDENDVRYDPESEIIVTAGATEAIFLTLLAFVDPGEEVLIPDPCWTYEPGIRAAGGVPRRYPLDPTNGFRPDVAAMRAAVTDDTALVVVNSPHNPTGSAISEADLRALKEVVLEHDLLLLSDEIYEKIVYGETAHRTPASDDELYERTITVNGFSKAYSMTGWRLGYLGAPANLIDPIIRVRQYSSTCAPSVSQYAGIRALEGDLHQPLVETFTNRRKTILDRIEDIPGMEMPEPAGAFYAFPTIPGESDDKAFVRDLLREAGVATVPGTVFGPSGAGRLRIAYSNSRERIDTGFDRLEQWLETR